MICPTNLLESSYWNLSWLIVACTTREDPESGQIWTQVRCLARDNLETNSITMKPETVSHMVEQFSYLLVSGVPLPTGLCPGITSQSFALSALVSHWTIHFRMLDKSLVMGPGRDFSSCNRITAEKITGDNTYPSRVYDYCAEKQPISRDKERKKKMQSSSF